MSKKMVDRELLLKWVEALESDKYTQSRFSLKSNQGYCCLGVLAEALDLKFTSEPPGVYYLDESLYSPGVNKNVTAAFLPEHIWGKLGIDEEQMVYINFNDALKNKTFKDIANHIRQKYLE